MRQQLRDLEGNAHLRECQPSGSGNTAASDQGDGRSVSQLDAPTIDPSCESLNTRVPVRVRHLLIETYLNSSWNARLLLDQRSLWRDLEDGLVSACVLSAIYAAATMSYLRPEIALSDSHIEIFDLCPNVKQLAQQWAEAAGRETLQAIDKPKIASVRVCSILSLYWKSLGESERSLMLSGIGFNCALIVGLNADNGYHDVRRFQRECGFTPEPLDTWRRCFWATWIDNCINGDQYAMAAVSKSRIWNLPLPEAEGARNGEIGASFMTLSALNNRQEASSNYNDAGADATIELIKATAIWVSLGDFFDVRRTQSARKLILIIMDIDQSISDWDSSLPGSLRYSRHNLYEQFVVRQKPEFVFMHCLRHASRLVLRSSLVPEFSGMSYDDKDPAELVCVSARIALKAASAISNLAADLVALDCDLSRLPPFVGYCMYASASIHILFLFSKDPGLSEFARDKLSSNLKILETLKEYWSNLRHLWARIEILCEAQFSRSQASAYGKDSQVMTTLQNGLGGIASTQKLTLRERREHKLNEPLAESMLRYNVRLETPACQERNTLSASESRILSDPLSRILKQALQSSALEMDPQYLSTDHETQAHGSSLPQISLQDHARVVCPGGFYASADTGTQDATHDAELSTDEALSTDFWNLGGSSSLPFYLQEPTDWWSVDLDALNQTVMSLGSLAEFDLDQRG